MAVTLHGPLAAPATCACSKRARGAPPEPAESDASLNIRSASERLLDANCPWALATRGAHFGPLTSAAGSAEATALTVAEGLVLAAVAMGGAEGRMRNSHPK